jgi:hypothetical protein
MPTNTYDELQRITVTTATPSITFTGINQGYTDLVLVADITMASPSGTAYIVGRVGNGSIDSGTSYSSTVIYGNGTSAASYRTANVNYFQCDTDITGTQKTTLTMHFNNYSSTTNNKTFIGRSSNGSKNVSAITNLWRNSVAINTFQLYDFTGNNFAVGSTFSLYGIKTEPVIGATAKATGGTITYDSFGNVIHTFTSSGTFTPTANLTNVEYLVLAGGGAGGVNQGAGGGAGGYRSSVFGELSGGRTLAEDRVTFANATNYTITVGAGGSGGFNSTPQSGQSGSPSSIAGSGFTTISAAGGGGGGAVGFVGLNGGSGGGGGGSGSPGTGTVNQGFGGIGSAGGGAGGLPISSNAGGVGLFSGITGVTIGRAGGSAYQQVSTWGAGQTDVSAGASSGATNRGGGGAPWDGTYNSGSGGSGVVVIRYSGL